MFSLCSQALFFTPHCCFWSWLEKGTQVLKGLASDSDPALNCRSFSFLGGHSSSRFQLCPWALSVRTARTELPATLKSCPPRSCCLMAQPSSRTSCWVMAVHLPASEPQRLLFPPPAQRWLPPLLPDPFRSRAPPLLPSRSSWHLNHLS